MPPNESKYQLNFETLTVTENALEVELLNTVSTQAKFKLTLTALQNSTFRLIVDEVNPLYSRFRVKESLDGEPKVAK